MSSAAAQHDPQHAHALVRSPSLSLTRSLSQPDRHAGALSHTLYVCYALSHTHSLSPSLVRLTIVFSVVFLNLSFGFGFSFGFLFSQFSVSR